MLRALDHQPRPYPTPLSAGIAFDGPSRRIQAPAVRSSLALVCSHRPACPGCPRFGERGLATGVLEELTALGERGGLPGIPVTEGARLGFRHRARLAVRGRSENPKIGI